MLELYTEQGCPDSYSLDIPDMKKEIHICESKTNLHMPSTEFTNCYPRYMLQPPVGHVFALEIYLVFHLINTPP